MQFPKFIGVDCSYIKLTAIRLPYCFSFVYCIADCSYIVIFILNTGLLNEAK